MSNTPATEKWFEIKTNNFTILFPEGAEYTAQKTANTLESLSDSLSSTMGGIVNSWPIIIRNQHAISNGFVTMGPKRSEIFTTPPQNYNFIGTNDWLEKVLIHEYRHIAQYNHSKRGWGKFFYYIFGENTLSALSFTAAPTWFWEGDAVLTETLYTNSGRGRIPEFNNYYRLNLLENKKINTYSKQYLGSYKDYVPNHYVLGYNFVSQLRKKYDDPDLFEKVTENAFSKPFIPFIFSSSLKKYTGKNLLDNYKEFNLDLKSGFEEELSYDNSENYQSLVLRKKSSVYTDYEFPHMDNYGNILVLKSGIGDYSKFVSLDNAGKENTIYVPGIINSSGMISIKGKYIIWNQFYFHPRWDNISYSSINIFNTV
ncbi:MAG: hypothetical protein OEY34_03995, partial [Cyclobacteriaceae bacterium]|nr:hypothetical protein [Cyclobacteriaceae bacterium]